MYKPAKLIHFRAKCCQKYALYRKRLSRFELTKSYFGQVQIFVLVTFEFLSVCGVYGLCGRRFNVVAFKPLLHKNSRIRMKFPLMKKFCLFLPNMINESFHYHFIILLTYSCFQRADMLIDYPTAIEEGKHIILPADFCRQNFLSWIRHCRQPHF